MATRLYLPSTGSPPAAPSFSGAWEDTLAAVRLPAATAKSGTSALAFIAGGSGSGGGDVLAAQFVSPPLVAQTLAGTVKGQIKAREADPDVDARAQLLIWVMQPDGGVRGTLLGAQAEALSSEFPSGSATNRKFPLASLSPAAITTVVAEEGDRIVIEVGALCGDRGLDSIQITFQDDQASDLAEDEVATGAANPWIEFSDDITFGDESEAAVRFSSLGPGLGVGL